MVYAELDISVPEGILGYTSSTGTFITKNIKRFPGLFNLPDMKHTGPDSPEPLSTFRILDTATFVLYDTVTRKMQTFNRVIKNKLNKFEIVWKPTEITSLFINPFLLYSNYLADKGNLRGNSPLGIDWELLPIYPNPFNYYTTILFKIQSNSLATITCSDFLGDKYRVLMNQITIPGVYAIGFRVSNDSISILSTIPH